MYDLNKVMMLGRVTRDPVVRYTPNNKAVADFGIAVGRKFRTASGEDREETTFVDCAIWDKAADIFNQYVKKGRQVYIEGRLKLDQWDDKQTGQKRSKLSIVVEDFILLAEPRHAGGPSQDDQGGQPRSTGYSRPGGYGGARSQQPAQPASEPETPYNDEQQFKEDDIPF